ncbi:hypothetical protein GF327_00640 [Candidatus Woesearchaeota archaeon]|nr:hypothetical protein [Candidatus Woesearchaeota archaeon]
MNLLKSGISGIFQKFQEKTILIKKNILLSVSLVLFLFFFLFYDTLFVFLIFVLLDLLFSILSSKYKIDCILDYLLVGIILFGYSFSVKAALLMSGFYLVNRVVQAKLEIRHFKKILPMVVISYLSNLLNRFPVFYIGTFLIFLRYVIEYLFDYLLFGDLKINRLLRRIVHLITGGIFFFVFGEIFVNILKK